MHIDTVENEKIYIYFNGLPLVTSGYLYNNNI